MNSLSCLYVAAAIAVNKEKPNHLSVQEYFQSIRQHTTTFQGNSLSSKNIDYSAFWQSQHDVLRGHLEETLDEVFVLKQRNEALDSQVAKFQAKATCNPRKRKNGGSVDQGATKKHKSDSPFTQTQDTLGPLQEVPSTRAMRHIHRVQLLCKGNMYGTEARDLSYHLIQAIEALTLVVENLPRGSEPTRNHLRSTTIALARSCISVFHGLKRLSALPNSGDYPSHVIYSSVCFFDSLFTSIEEVSSQQTKAHTPADFQQTSENLSLLTALATSLTSNLQESCASCSQHADIIEGLTYHLLHRLGEVTHELLLEGPRHPEIEHEIHNLPLAEDDRLDPTRLASLKSMTLQAPYMLTVLKRAITSATCLSTSLVRSVRAKLQRTLVECIFGPRNGSRSSDDVLRIPDALGEPPIPSIGDRSDDIEKAKDDFESELWALVGWDILCRDEDL